MSKTGRQPSGLHRTYTSRCGKQGHQPWDMLDQGSVCLPDHLFASAVFQAATLASVEFRYSPAVSLTVLAAIHTGSAPLCCSLFSVCFKPI